MRIFYNQHDHAVRPKAKYTTTTHIPKHTNCKHSHTKEEESVSENKGKGMHTIRLDSEHILSQTNVLVVLEDNRWAKTVAAASPFH
jgi:hypothetical protein